MKIRQLKPNILVGLAAGVAGFLVFLVASRLFLVHESPRVKTGIKVEKGIKSVKKHKKSGKGKGKELKLMEDDLAEYVSDSNASYSSMVSVNSDDEIQASGVSDKGGTKMENNGVILASSTKKKIKKFVNVYKEKRNKLEQQQKFRNSGNKMARLSPFPGSIIEEENGIEATSYHQFMDTNNTNNMEGVATQLQYRTEGKKENGKESNIAGRTDQIFFDLFSIYAVDYLHKTDNPNSNTNLK